MVREGFSGEVTFELKVPTMGRLSIEHSRWKGGQVQMSLACLGPLCLGVSRARFPGCTVGLDKMLAV